MRLPEISIETCHLGCWVSPEDISLLIPPIAKRYYERYKRAFYGDEQDLEQEAHLALWLMMKDREDQERVRELEALSCITQAIQKEIKATQRSGPLMLSSQEVNWKALAQPDHQLTDTQAELLYRFQMRCSQAARDPAWSCLWLLKAIEWEPVDVSWWFRTRKGTKEHKARRILPDEVVQLAEGAEKRIRKLLNPDYLTELNNISQMFWAVGEENKPWSMGKPDGR